MKLELYYPIKPFDVHQKWGIYNPAYTQFGFDHHNGIDLGLGDKLCAPVRIKIIAQPFFPNGAGNMVEAVTTEMWDDENGNPTYWLLAFMHNEKFLHNVGDILEVGDEVAIPDNTGFSTGPHCHFGLYKCDINGNKTDTSNLSYAEGSSDPQIFFNGFYAEDKNIVIPLLQKVVNLLILLKNKLTNA